MQRCVSCQSEITAGGRFCPSCGTDSTAPTITTDPPSSGTAGERFYPGQVLARRYRIVALLGSGGMGEVYRADDLKLGQPVALKFLPHDLADDPKFLTTLYNEVKTARRIGHPNVCRVYDVGEAEGMHFLSMELVDGENLATLLHRIGRLPGEKGVQIARQLCAGLAAAHEQGILHRDLKPANVMIDGRGRVRIMDFGLAGLIEEVGRGGTPAYMAPEQRRGDPATVQSDLYALGLVLYELFTGKHPFAGKPGAPAEDPGSSPSTPSDLVADLDPAVERVTLRCLEPEPSERPTSAMAVAAALPGGDPLAAVLAAGETPSPDMVAAAGPRGGLSRGMALGLLISILIATLGYAILAPRAQMYGHVPITKPLAALAENARGILMDLGYQDPPTDRAFYLFNNPGLLRHLADQDDAPSPWDIVSDPAQPVVGFFYRESPGLLVPLNTSGRIRISDPPEGPGDVSLNLNLEGKLRFLRVVPPQVSYPGEPAPPTDWAALFEAAGWNIEEFTPTQPTLHRVPSDTRAAWSGTLPIAGGLPVRIEAASFQGKPIYFEPVVPFDRYWSVTENEGSPAPTGFPLLGIFLFGVAAAGLALAVRNYRQGRGDRRGSLRIAASVVALSALYRLFTGHHVPGSAEISLFVKTLGNALLLGLVAWLMYMAIEPLARRWRPEALVSWSRLLAGRFRDPMLGRDVLVGFTVHAAITLTVIVIQLLPALRGLPAGTSLPVLAALRGGRFAIGGVFLASFQAIAGALGMLLVYLLLRLILRWNPLAIAAFILIIAAPYAAGLAQSGDSPAWLAAGLIGGLIGGVCTAFVLLRFGLVALAAGALFQQLLRLFPLTLDASVPYFSTSLLGLALIVGLALYAFSLATATGRTAAPRA